MNRITDIPAEQLHPGDIIVGPLPSVYAKGTTLQVRDPGVFVRGGLNATPTGCVEAIVFGPDPAYPWTSQRVHTLTIAAEWPFTIDRPNLVIPGLEK